MGDEGERGGKTSLNVTGVGLREWRQSISDMMCSSTWS